MGLFQNFFGRFFDGEYHQDPDTSALETEITSLDSAVESTTDSSFDLLDDESVDSHLRIARRATKMVSPIDVVRQAFFVMAFFFQLSLFLLTFTFSFRLSFFPLNSSFIPNFYFLDKIIFLCSVVYLTRATICYRYLLLIIYSTFRLHFSRRRSCSTSSRLTIYGTCLKRCACGTLSCVFHYVCLYCLVQYV